METWSHISEQMFLGGIDFVYLSDRVVGSRETNNVGGKPKVGGINNYSPYLICIYLEYW